MSRYYNLRKIFIHIIPIILPSTLYVSLVTIILLPIPSPKNRTHSLYPTSFLLNLLHFEFHSYFLTDISLLRSAITFFFFFNNSLFYLFIFDCVGSSFLCEDFLQLWQAGATLHCGARASHYRGLSCCRAQAPDAQAQQLWLTGLFAPRHVGSSQTRARTRVPCIGRQILNHCATREAQQ